MGAKNISGEQKELMSCQTGTLSRQKRPLLIGALEAALLAKFPVKNGKDWDRIGLLVGDRSALVTGVACALDPTVEAVYKAQSLGANVLLTHHPAFVTAPESFAPAVSTAQNPGAGVWAAIENNIALMCLHTTLDVSQEAAQILPKMLNLHFVGILNSLEENSNLGYGQRSVPASTEPDLSLGQLAARCTAVFGRQPRVWGDFNSKVSQIVTCTGSAGDTLAKALAAGVDCFICGEVRYHDALSASQAGLAIIDLGHDTSELPLVAVLAASVESILGTKNQVKVIDQVSNWTYPESVRV